MNPEFAFTICFGFFAGGLFDLGCSFVAEGWLESGFVGEAGLFGSAAVTTSVGSL
jgi:hypothetical protein